MDIAGIRNKDGLALIENPLFSNQVAWLHECIAPDRDVKQMMEWLKAFYDNQTLTKEDQDSLIARAIKYPKSVEPEFIFTLGILCQPLYSLLQYRLDNNIEG